MLFITSLWLKPRKRRKFENMDTWDDVLKEVSLFEDIGSEERASMLSCLGVKTATYKKGEHLLTAGDRPESIGIVLIGQLHVLKEDIDGNRTLLATLGPSDLFAEALCCAELEESPFTVLAATDATVMLCKFSRILSTCPNSCAFHQKLVANMLKVVAQKNLYLQKRMELVRTRSIRAKVLGYLESYAIKQGSTITIPLNREEMADYLCVERSALSHELIRMKHDGLIDYRKNKFTLL